MFVVAALPGDCVVDDQADTAPAGLWLPFELRSDNKAPTFVHCGRIFQEVLLLQCWRRWHCHYHVVVDWMVLLLLGAERKKNSGWFQS